MTTLKLQDRGRPIRQFSVEDWQLIEDCAKRQLTMEVCAARLGVQLETLKGTEGFSSVWASKKAEGQARLNDRLWDVAEGVANATMPQAATAMFLSKQPHILGYSDRQDVRVQHEVKFEIAFEERRKLPPGETPGQLIEGEARELLEGTPGPADSQEEAPDAT